MQTHNFHISRNGEMFGPYTLEEVRAYVAQGRILPSDLAWVNGASQWTALTAIPDLFDPRPPPSVPPPPATPPTPGEGEVRAHPPPPPAASPGFTGAGQHQVTAVQKPAANLQGCLALVLVVFLLLIIVGYFTGGDSGSKSQPKVLSKVEWRARVVKHYGQVAQLNIVYNWRPSEFKALMGEPESTQTIGDQAFWYYQCSDGMIQLDLYAPNLAAGVMQGKINDY
jgi:hypothetical protein